MSAPGAPAEISATTDALLAGRYRLLDQLGQGGMGAVFRALDVTLGRHVAVKILPAGKLADPDAVARFRREALALAHLSHPNIVQAHDSGHEGQHFLVMELVEGRSLSSLLANQGKVAPTRAADFGHQAARALQYAHKSGLVHRDVKPSNFLLMADGTVKLLDLGLARFLQDQIGDATLTRADAGMGTPDYCAPEQFRNAHSADPRADIYSLGCTLYHLIGGRVPFPGSSLSEKLKSHETLEPTPLAELCPEVPVGLALAVGRMMAKRPRDRFQSMTEVAEALAPYVASSSPSSRALEATSTWDGSQLTITFNRPGRRAPRFLVACLIVTLFLAGGGAWLGLQQGWFRSQQEEVASAGENEEPNAKEPRTPGELNKVDPLPDEPGVLTVSQKPEDGGKHRTIRAALEKVRPHQTIRIVDAGVYRETLLLNRRSSHEGITIEAPRGAVLEKQGKGINLITISGIRGVVLRNLRLRHENENPAVLVFVTRECSDITIEQVDFRLPSNSRQPVGIEVLEVPANVDSESPCLLVRDCRFTGGHIGIHLAGVDRFGEKYGSANPTHAVAIRDNHFLDCEWGLCVRGDVRKLQVVGNRFRRCTVCAWQIEHLLVLSRDILVANNTTLECNLSMRFWDDRVPRRDVRICNNLSLDSSYPDAKALDSGGNTRTPRGVADGAKYAARWSFDHNWREVKLPAKPPGEPDGWIPPSKRDILKETIDGINRDPRSADFLRPDKDSPLATSGAGQDDPTLPSYIGALPPAGGEPWDWDRAWRMPKNAALLKVSKRLSDGGKYRRIRDALKDATPWATIRVLDDRGYEETIRLDDPKKHLGLTLEAPKGATLRLVEPALRLLTIRDVPHVCIRGFKLSDDGQVKDGIRTFARVRGNVTGVVLARLHLVSRTSMNGLEIQNARAAPGQPPLRVEGCIIRPECARSNDGINVSGSDRSEPTRGILLRDNQIHRCLRGIILTGLLQDISAVGNLVVGSSYAALQIENLAPDSRGLLFANNTAFSSNICFRVWDDLPAQEHRMGQVEVVNNLFFEGHAYDVGCIEAPRKGDVKPGDGKALLKLWSFHHNGRDFGGAAPSFILPAGVSDARLRESDLLAIAPDDPTRTRPKKGSPLASQGAGAKGGNLPAYIGALPPAGVEPWDWQRTRRSRR